MVLFILVDLTVPDKIRPRMEMLPVKGHFLSMYVPVQNIVCKRACQQSLGNLCDAAENFAGVKLAALT